MNSINRHTQMTDVGRKPPGYLRTAMPSTSAFIDSLRAAFGADQIDGSIRRGAAGEKGFFHATEAGNEIGTAFDNNNGIRPYISQEMRGE